jgi:hypothetical protein
MDSAAPTEPVGNFRFAYGMAAVLLASGLFHLIWLVITAASWEGATSPRKPALFGISAGLTAWSIVWVLTKVQRRPWDVWFANILTASLVLEVALITLQFWRGVPSHFNRSTGLDATIELGMLLLILEVTGGIAWLTVRCNRLTVRDAAMAIAIRGGMWLLLISCLLGIVITLLGTMNLLSGNSPERWGRAGVLKYPHGVALHAIQTLPILAWVLVRLRVEGRDKLVLSALIAQIIFLVVATWQTANGRARFDLDLVGFLLIGVAVALAMLPVFAIVLVAIRPAFKRNN